MFSSSSLDTVSMLSETITGHIRAHLMPSSQTPQLLLPSPTLTRCCPLFTSVSRRRFCSLSSRSRRCSCPCCRRISSMFLSSSCTRFSLCADSDTSLSVACFFLHRTCHRMKPLASASPWCPLQRHPQLCWAPGWAEPFPSPVPCSARPPHECGTPAACASPRGPRALCPPAPGAASGCHSALPAPALLPAPAH